MGGTMGFTARSEFRHHSPVTFTKEQADDRVADFKLDDPHGVYRVVTFEEAMAVPRGPRRKVAVKRCPKALAQIKATRELVIAYNKGLITAAELYLTIKEKL